MSRPTASVVWTLALTGAAMLPGSSHAQSEPPIEQDRDEPAIVYVENGNWLDVRVYAMRPQGIYDRIGTVRSYTTREFELPSWVTSSNRLLQLVVSPIGSRQRYAAPPVIVSAGDVVDWKLGANLSNSTISVRAGWNDH